MTADVSDAVIHARRRTARWAGALYLGFILASVAADQLGHLGLSESQEVRTAILDSEVPFRLGLAAAMGSALLFVLAAWALYVLLRPVNDSAALLLLTLNAIGVAVQIASYLPLLGALAGVDNAAQQPATVDLDQEAAVAVATYQSGFASAQLFFSAWLFPLGWLVIRSGFLPRLLGWLLLLDGVAILVWFLQALTAPDYPAISYPAWAVSFVAEVALGLWLLIRGTGTGPAPAPAVPR
jgi:hypothetical protein